MNFNELKQELFARGTNYLEESAEEEARAERWLNQSYRRILNLQAWSFLQADTTGSADAGTVTVPDLRRATLVVDTSTGDERPLRRAFLEDLERQGEDLTRTGTPEFYYIRNGGAVSTFPRGGTIKVYYIKRVAPMSGTDEPIFDEEYHDLIVDGAMVKAYKDSDNFEAAEALKEEMNEGLAAMAEDYMVDSADRTYIYVEPYDG